MSVYMLLSSLTGYFKWRSLAEKTDIDGFAAKMHYKITAAVFIGCSLLVAGTHLIGNPISCITDAGVPAHVIGTFCWISYTYTLPDLSGKRVGTVVAHPGVGPDADDERVRQHSYYQWVPIMLFCQGAMFYAPHWLWKLLEAGKVRMVTDGVRVPALRKRVDRLSSNKRIVRYLIDSLRTHDLYAACHYICEVLNFLNVIANVVMMDRFLGGEFFSYGTRVLGFSMMEQRDRVDPMIAIFPRMTKCKFNKFGPSGTIQTHDALCVLALNVLNEKIYIFLWFWLILLATVTGVSLGYHLVLTLKPTFRQKMMLRRFKFGSPLSVSTLFKKMRVGDFLLLDLVGQNMNLLQFKEVLEELTTRLNN